MLMTRDEALTLLGVDADTDPRARKRAYLRRLKQTKPERDPEGFKRLREAYELLEAELESLAEVREHVDVYVPPPLPPAPPTAMSETAATEPLADPRPPFYELVRGAYAALDAEDFDSLWRCVDEALARSEAGDPNLPKELVVEATLTAFVHGDPEPARIAFTRWSTSSESFDVVRAEGGVEDQAVLALTAELVGLPSKFPPEFAALIASALLQGDPDSERERIVALADERLIAADFAHDLLMHHAPGLLALYESTLGDGKTKTEILPRYEWTDHPLVNLLYLAIAMGLMFLIDFMQHGCASAP